VTVILGTSIPFEVETISRIADALGVVVPMPALPVEGNMFVCASVQWVQTKRAVLNARLCLSKCIFFMFLVFKIGLQPKQAVVTDFSCLIKNDSLKFVFEIYLAKIICFVSISSLSG
jgi:hypothetical protein